MPDARENQILADLANHPGWNILRDHAKQARDGYFVNLAKALHGGQPVNDLVIAEKRGFFRGIFYLLNKPVITAKELAREAEAQPKDDDV